MDILIGIKFCGGCNPRYDRKLKKEEIENKLFTFFKALKTQFNIEHAREDAHYKYLIVIGGCSTCCASYDQYKADKVIKIKDISDMPIEIYSFQEEQNGVEEIL